MRLHRIATGAILGLMACTLNLSGLRPPKPEIKVVPSFFCQGEPVEVRWALSGIDRDRSFCAAPDGGVSPRTQCTSDAACSGGASCIDGLCVLPGIDPSTVDFGAGCYAPVAGSITEAPNSGGHLTPFTTQSGRLTFGPRGTTNYGAVLRGSGGVRSTTRHAATLVPPAGQPPLVRVVEFQAACSNTSGSITLDFADLAPDTITGSPRTRIVRVTNPGSTALSVLTRYSDRGPVMIDGGMTTTGLNGTIPQVWTVTPVASGDGDPVRCVNGRLQGTGGAVLAPLVLSLELSCAGP
ncbi:MAG: hypothetical protein KDA50_07000 [Rhodobacteraceae bacterium]|nr:hypothetical protein [Paracoccaceae bacterium]